MCCMYHTPSTPMAPSWLAKRTEKCKKCDPSTSVSKAQCPILSHTRRGQSFMGEDSYWSIKYQNPCNIDLTQESDENNNKLKYDYLMIAVWNNINPIVWLKYSAKILLHESNLFSYCTPSPMCHHMCFQSWCEDRAEHRRDGAEG